ncbi:glycosyltransferase family 4 protein [Patescibacteria group bacterium]
MMLGIDASRANKKKRTGVEWYSYFLIQKFKKLIPQDVDVILYSPSPLKKDLLPLPPNWKVKILNWPLGRFWTLLRFSWEMLQNKPDRLFVPSHIIPFFAPKKTFTTIHDIGFKRFPESYSWLQRLLQNFGTKRALSRAQTIFVPSEFTKKELKEVYGAPSEKITTTHLGSEAEPDTAVSSLIIEKYKIKKPYLFYVGRLEKKKNIENIIRAFEIFSAQNPNYSLVLAGSPGYGFNNVKCQMSNVKCLNWIPTEDLPALMAEADIFLYPSLYEGFGIPILEAFSCGTPVITSNRASMPEVAGGAANLVNPESPEEIASAIQQILNNIELKQNLINKGLKRSQAFSWYKCALETLEIILQ